MKGIQFLVAFVVLALASSFASASDPSPLQDFCVAIDDYKSGGMVSTLYIYNNLSGPDLFSNITEICNKCLVFVVNGKFCKDPKLATKRLLFSGLNIPKDTSNPIGSNVTQVNVAQIAGLNTLGVSLARIDYAPCLCGLSSQNPGVITIANAVFGSDPPINPDFLARAFQLDQKVVKSLQAKFWWDNN
ncbi:hypothetical protein LWI29_020387 [Acer saccharum]|uniref:Cupin type-1 domain-containing protein n=1 Tax=Acer saccharum TaxID=4024 RepID=A0AA39W247_ACESA|nr:hypothetical protein LWI29_020387 [Acer saccharum]